MPSSSRRTPGPCVGVLIDSIGEDYQRGVLQGILDACEAHNSLCVTFVGGALPGPTRPDRGHHAIYDLAKSQPVEGLVVLASLSHTQRGVSNFVERFRLPMAGVGAEIPGTPSAFPDNAAGMAALVEHVISHHGARRIAYISGPEGNVEAMERLAGATSAALRLGAPLDQRLQIEGDYMTATGFSAISKLAGTPGIRLAELDAVVAANDAMALGALEALRARGVRVPEDVIVAGFDDIDDARVSVPALTTVRQPLARQGDYAVRAVLAQLRGEPTESSKLATELVCRRSCGCGVSARPDAHSEAPAPSFGFEASVLTRRTQIVVALRRATLGNFGGVGQDWADRLVNAVLDEVRGNHGVLDEVFASLLERMTAVGLESLERAEALVDVLRAQLTPLLVGAPERRHQLESALHGIRKRVSEAQKGHLLRHALKAGRGAREITEACLRMAASFDRHEVQRVVERELPHFGLTTCLVMEYIDADWARFAFGFDSAGGDSISRSPFPRQQVAPADWLFRRIASAPIAVLPLCANQELVGHVVFECQVQRAYSYAPIAESISIGTFGATLLADRRQA